jgi:ubiquinol-cytochrome c reductase cytochrome c subunit
VNSLTARRRHPFAAFVVLLLALGVTGVVYGAFAPARSAEAAAADTPGNLEAGKKLFITNCSSCHGLTGQGTSDGPSLIGVGAAAVDFQVGTGRMPAARPEPQMPRKPVQFAQPQIDDLSAFVASLGPGPSVPEASQYDATDGDLAKGGDLFRTNCAACHNFAGQGGALTRGKYAPDLKSTTPRHLYEAMQTGPQAMPVFNDNTMPPEQKRAIIAFVRHTVTETNDGGLNLGRIGPVSEGLFLWTFGLGILIAVAVWIGAKTGKPNSAVNADSTTHE